MKEQVLFADGMEIVCPRQEDAFCLKNQEKKYLNLKKKSLSIEGLFSVF